MVQVVSDSLLEIYTGFVFMQGLMVYLKTMKNLELLLIFLLIMVIVTITALLILKYRMIVSYTKLLILVHLLCIQCIIKPSMCFPQAGVPGFLSSLATFKRVTNLWVCGIWCQPRLKTQD